MAALLSEEDIGRAAAPPGAAAAMAAMSRHSRPRSRLMAPTQSTAHREWDKTKPRGGPCEERHRALSNHTPRQAPKVAPAASRKLPPAISWVPTKDWRVAGAAGASDRPRAGYSSTFLWSAMQPSLPAGLHPLDGPSPPVVEQSSQLLEDALRDVGEPPGNGRWSGGGLAWEPPEWTETVRAARRPSDYAAADPAAEASARPARRPSPRRMRRDDADGLGEWSEFAMRRPSREPADPTAIAERFLSSATAALFLGAAADATTQAGEDEEVAKAAAAARAAAAALSDPSPEAQIEHCYEGR